MRMGNMYSMNNLDIMENMDSMQYLHTHSNMATLLIMQRRGNNHGWKR